MSTILIAVTSDSNCDSQGQAPRLAVKAGQYSGVYVSQKSGYIEK